jgi:hypothetical protein
MEGMREGQDRMEKEKGRQGGIEGRATEPGRLKAHYCILLQVGVQSVTVQGKKEARNEGRA